MLKRGKATLQHLSLQVYNTTTPLRPPSAKKIFMVPSAPRKSLNPFLEPQKFYAAFGGANGNFTESENCTPLPQKCALRTS